MTRSSDRRRNKSPMLDQNRVLPTDYTTIVRDWLNELPPTPKYDYLKSNVFEKFVDSNTVPADVRRERAIAKWLSMEAVNEETNLRLSTTPEDTVLLPNVRFGPFVEKCRSIISSIIGELPSDTALGSFSGGASTSRKRTLSTPAEKYVGKAHITSACLDVFDPADYPVWSVLSRPELITVEGASMFTVPKNAEIDRVACKEPDINMFLQKGAGSQIRKCLRKVGINLQDQGRNRELAREGSRTGELATLDLSSASDTVSHEIVFQLMPICWYSYLNSIRSQVIVINGQRHFCEMFSSMGNGFTFELESLLFYALARTTAYFTGTKGVISVYGDDLIIPSRMYHAFAHVLFYFGFSPNNAKSFHEGPFRESCGGHYWNGNDITPFFVRRPIDRLSELLLFLNNLRIWSGRGQSLFLDDVAWPLWSLFSQDVPLSLKGGDVTSSGRTQLVSPGNPRKRLQPVTKDKSLPPEGVYLQSLNEIQDRSFTPMVDDFEKRKRLQKLALKRAQAGLEPIDDHSSKVVLGRCRLSSTQKWTWHSCGMLFVEETA